MTAAAPYPAETRAKGWRFEIDHERIFDQSETWSLAPAELKPWMLMLWLIAWRQTPCGSLPDDDELIAAKIGMSAKMYTKHRRVIRRGWWTADDGRLYHETITIRVRAMLDKRASDAQRAANRRANERTPPELPPESRVTHIVLAGDSTVSSTPSTKHQEEKQNPGRARATRLPADWQLPDDWKAVAEKLRPELNPGTVADNFRDFWVAEPGKGGCKLDWLATWRKWVRNEKAPRVNGHHIAAITVPSTAAAETAARLAEQAEHARLAAAESRSRRATA